MSGLQLNPDALVASPGAGLLEFDGSKLTMTPVAGQRGIVPTEQFYRLDSDLAGANATGAQNALGVGVTLASNTVYEFEVVLEFIKTAGTTSHNFQLSFGGTAAVNNISYSGKRMYNASSSGSFSSSTSADFANNTTSSLVVDSALVAAAVTELISIRGTVSVGAGGTFIPQYSLSAAPGGAYSTKAGSYMKIKPVGAAGANTSVGAWA